MTRASRKVARSSWSSGTVRGPKRQFAKASVRVPELTPMCLQGRTVTTASADVALRCRASSAKRPTTVTIVVVSEGHRLGLAAVIRVSTERRSQAFRARQLAALSWLSRLAGGVGVVREGAICSRLAQLSGVSWALAANGVDSHEFG